MAKKEVIITRRQGKRPKKELKVTPPKKRFQSVESLTGEESAPNAPEQPPAEPQAAQTPPPPAAVAPPAQPQPEARREKPKKVPTVSRILQEGRDVLAKQPPEKTVRVITRKNLPRAVKVLKKGRQGAALYNELLNSVYDGVIITDLSGRVLETNPRAREFLQYGPGEISRASILNVICGADAQLLETLRQNVDDNRFTLLEAWCARKDHSRFPAEIAINLIHLSKQGELCFFVRDITLRKRAEALLRTEHNAIQNSANGIVITDTEGKIEYLNPAFLALWGCEDADEAVDHPLREFLRDGDTLDAIFRDLAQQDVWTGEMVATQKNGTPFYVQVSAAPNRDSAGESIGMVFSFLDVTERKKAEDALNRANEELMKGEKVKARLDTITTLSHEINNPLQMLLSMVELEGNQRYKAPLERIIAVLRELRKQEELPTVTYAGGLERYQLSEEELLTPCDNTRVLIVDDEEDLRRMFGEVLGSAISGVEIDYAANGQEALDIFEKHHHAVIVLDVVMPRMNGEKAFLELQGFCRAKEWKMPAVIFCTAFVPPEIVKQTVAEDSRHCFMPKPIGKRDLIKAVEDRL
ncbi:MAG: PAS domain-containing protein [Kiritimatiellae bacterium]|nr:PAS domain-containing protein [Kiritimatiellia bacterium]